jgi:hypothetical protein
MELSRISREFQHRPPYTRGWDVLGRHLYDTLVDEGFSPRQSDGELLAGLCLRRRFWPDIPRRFTCPLERDSTTYSWTLKNLEYERETLSQLTILWV